MGIPINIAGLNEFIQEIPDGNIVILQGTIDPIKTIFTQTLAGYAVRNNKEVIYIASRAKEKIISELSFYTESTNYQIIEERSHHHWKDFIKEDRVVIIDSFSYLVLDKSLSEVRAILEELDALCKQRHAILLLTLEFGMLDEKLQITIGHMADGIIHFLSKETTKGVARFIRISKWMDRDSFIDNIYYTFDHRVIKIDLRARIN
jgi:archaellum biogenesis ATPase FlaH